MVEVTTRSNDGGFEMDEYNRRLDEIVGEVLPADHPANERLRGEA